MKKQISKTAVIIYIVSGLLLLSFCLSAYNVTVYIQGLLEAGQITLTSNWLEIVLYYMNNTALYLALAVMLYGMGYVVSYLKSQTKELVEEVETVEEEQDETVETNNVATVEENI